MPTISTFQIIREKKEVHLTHASGKKEVLSFNTTEKIKEYVKELLEKTSAKFVLSPFRFVYLQTKAKICFCKLEDCENFRDFIAPEIFKRSEITSIDKKDSSITCMQLFEIERQIAILRRAPPVRLWSEHVTVSRPLPQNVPARLVRV